MLQEAEIHKVLVDGEEWAHWHGYHIPVSEEYFAIWTPMGSQMNWSTGNWVAAKHQLTYFWRERWYTIHIGYDKDGQFLSGYCDIVLPRADYNNTQSEMVYTDLYIDVVVRADHSVYTKDQEVYARAAKRFPIVEQSRQQAFAELDWLEGQAQAWTGPFRLFPRKLPIIDFERYSPEEAVRILRGVDKSDSKLSR
jgi:predicted RNA-binding protein associated with RNAse of E/G family